MTGDGELFEVFVRARRGVSHVHAGSVHAASAEMAMQYGRDLFTRRLEGVSLWVVPAAAITASQPADADELFDPAADKDYRYPSHYQLPDGIEHISSASIVMTDATTRFAVRHGDRCLVLSHRLQQCVTHAPQLEEELALANIALDLLGQARALYSYAASRLGGDLTEDDFAFLRGADEFQNPSLVEQPNVDFAAVMVRQLLHDLWAVEFWRSLSSSPDELFAGVAGKAVKETSYHVRHASEWVVTLGDSTDDAHRRTQSALDSLWPHVGELFEADADTADLARAGVAPDPASLRSAWDARIDAVLADATLDRPADVASVPTGQSRHRSDFAALIDEMQQLHRAFSRGAVVTTDPASVANAVLDPELPELTLEDLGIVRSVVVEHGTVVVTITPTYTGCPATAVMAHEIERALHAAGWADVDVRTNFSPAWTTDWITDEGRAKLQQAGIGQPPALSRGFEQAVSEPAPCPRCDSRRTRRRGMFGSSACREPYVCGACGEPFERIKPI